MQFGKRFKMSRREMPGPAVTRAIRYFYPWRELEPGEGFEFAPTIKIMSARVMCTNNGRELQRTFRCYRGVDERLYCLRVDGMTEPLPKPRIIPAPSFKAATAPTPGEVFGDFGTVNGREARDNAKNVLTPEATTVTVEFHKPDDDVI